MEKVKEKSEILRATEQLSKVDQIERVSSKIDKLFGNIKRLESLSRNSSIDVVLRQAMSGCWFDPS